MRWIALCFLLVPTVASGQTLASSFQAAQESAVEGHLDVLPAAAADATVIGSVAAGLGVAACVILTGLTQEDVTFNQSLLAAGVCGVLAGAAVCVNAGATPERIHAASGAAYDAGAVAAFAADRLSLEQRAVLAQTARRNGRAGVVLQRVVEPRAGVGGALGEAALEIAVVDAETGALRSVGSDALLPQTIVAIPVGDDLSSARTEALARFIL